MLPQFLAAKRPFQYAVTAVLDAAVGVGPWLRCIAQVEWMPRSR
jgi:hypothetical protein